MANETTAKKPLSGGIKFVGILLVISLVLTVFYIVGAIAVKQSIQKNLVSTISNLMESSGADRVIVQIFAEPEAFDPPWALEFHVFLTAEYPHLSQVNKDDALKILTNGGKQVSTEYSYDWEDLDYSLYARTTSDSVFGRIHPVFVMLSDGASYYGLKDGSYTSATLYSGNTLRRLNPPSVHVVTRWSVVITLFLLVIFIALLRKRAEKLKAIAAEEKKQRDIAKRNDRTFGIRHIMAELEEEVNQELAAFDRKNSKKSTKVLLIFLAVLVVVAALIVGLYLVPNARYNEAVKYQSEGRDELAYQIFSELGSFKDSRQIVNGYDYATALEHLDEKDYAAAYRMLKSISGHAEAEAKLAQLLKDHSYLTVLDAAEGSTVTLGTYEQDNNTANGAEPIEWTVLKNKDGIFFAVSKHILDTKPYNTRNTDDSTLLPWLRGDFHNKAFGKLPKGFISKVGLLTREDMSTYIRHVNNKPEWTAYAKAQKPVKHSYSGYSWWLDGDYFHGYGSSHVSMDVVIESGGYSNYSSDITSNNGVRPVIIIDCTGSDQDYYATEKSGTSTAVDSTTPASASAGKTNSGSGKTGSSYTANKTKCTRCNGTGKVVLHYGNSWNKKEGYRYGEKCGGCGGSGYVSK